MNGTEPVVSVRDLTRRFGDFLAVDAISFDVDRGEIFGFLGANGAGKTTTIRMLCGIIPPSSARRADVLAFDIRRDHERVKERIGYMSQRYSLYPSLSARENMLFQGGIHGLADSETRERGLELARMLDLAADLDTATGTLPAGVRQRVALACAVLHRPDLLFLDEPTAGVDPRMRREFWQLIDTFRVEGMTVFVTTHYMDEAEACHRISIMHSGRIVALGSPRELKTRAFPGILFATATVPDRETLAQLVHDGLVTSSARFGAGLHLHVPRPREKGFLKALPPQFRPEQVEPSLEDVFLEIARRPEEKNV